AELPPKRSHRCFYDCSLAPRHTRFQCLFSMRVANFSALTGRRPPVKSDAGSAYRPTPLSMTTITLDRVPRIVQGAGALDTLGTVVAELVPSGGAVLLVADPGLRGTGMIDMARAAL